MISKEVAQQAMDALEANHKWHVDYDDLRGYQESEMHTQNVAAITALRAAIEQPDEPACWVEPDHLSEMRDLGRGSWQNVIACTAKNSPSKVPLYLHPAPYVPLTDDEILSIAYDYNALPEVVTDFSLLAFARALERAVRGDKT